MGPGPEEGVQGVGHQPPAGAPSPVRVRVPVQMQVPMLQQKSEGL